MKWIYGRWWKWLSVVLLVYVVAGSFFVPLAPGVTRVTPLSFTPDSVYTFTINTYHAHLASPEAGKVQVFFKNGNNYYSPVSFKVIANNKAEAQFAVSSMQQHKFTPSNIDMVINNELDGTFALREAMVLIKSKEVDSSSAVSAVLTSPEVKNNHTSMISFPYREILYETIRNTFFHVPMWFAMTVLVFASLLYSVFYLAVQSKDLAVASFSNVTIHKYWKMFWNWLKSGEWDLMAEQSVIAAIFFGVCGYLTGLLWAKYTWFIGEPWGDVVRKLLLEDIKMAAALIAIFFYVAYLVLRNSFTDMQQRAKVSAIYNIAAFFIFMLCVYALPRLTDSVHPGNGGNPAFSKYDMDSTLRLFFYPAVIGWILLGFWVLSVQIRVNLIQQKKGL